MKHHSAHRTLGRSSNQHRALMRSLSRALILEGGIETTLAKAKEMRPFIERLVTKAKDDTVANRRLVASALGARSEASQRLFSDIATQYKDRPGGYTRIVRTRVRKDDAAVMAKIMFV